MVTSISLGAIAVFDRLERAWTSEATRVMLSRSLLVVFLSSIAWIELARHGVADTVFGRSVPTNHLAAISWIVTLLLVSEVVDLIFGLAESVANALGKQLEIFSLILLRKSLDELPKLGEPVVVAENLDVVTRMGADALGALLVFTVTLVYYRLQRHVPISAAPGAVDRFVRTKKLVCLGLVLAFVVTGTIAVARFTGLAVTPEASASSVDLEFFEVFFTALIFADVAIVLASLAATKTYHVIFRNFAFATVTVFLRLSLAAEPFMNSLLGAAAALFALATVWAARMGVGDEEASELLESEGS